MRFLEQGIAAVLTVLMSLLIALISVQVVMRFVFHSPLQWSLEVSRILFLWIVFLGAAVAVRRAQYASMDMIARHLPTWWAGRAIVFVMLIFSIMLAVLGARYLIGSDHGHFTMTGLPQLVVYVAPTVSGVLMALFSLELLLNGKDVRSSQESLSVRETIG